ncbi:hypothetical protein BsWGS_18166 [Bradybaena similaris]
MTFHFLPLLCLTLGLLVSQTPIQCHATEGTNNQVKRTKRDDVSTLDNHFKEQNYNGIPYLELGSSVGERQVDDAQVFLTALLNNDHQQDHVSYPGVPNKRENLADSAVNTHYFGASRKDINVGIFAKRQQFPEENPLQIYVKRPVFPHSFVGKQTSEFGYRFVGKRSPRFKQSFVGKRAPKVYISMKEYLEELRKNPNDLYYGKRTEDYDYNLPENLHEINPFMTKRGGCGNQCNAPMFVGKRALRSHHRFVGKDATGLRHSFVEKIARGSSHSLTRTREDMSSAGGDNTAQGSLTPDDAADISDFLLTDESVNDQLGEAANND